MAWGVCYLQRGERLLYHFTDSLSQFSRNISWLMMLNLYEMRSTTRHLVCNLKVIMLAVMAKVLNTKLAAINELL